MNFAEKYIKCLLYWQLYSQMMKENPSNVILKYRTHLYALLDNQPIMLQHRQKVISPVWLP